MIVIEILRNTKNPQGKFIPGSYLAVKERLRKLTLPTAGSLHQFLRRELRILSIFSVVLIMANKWKSNGMEWEEKNEASIVKLDRSSSTSPSFLFLQVGNQASWLRHLLSKSKTS